MRRIWNWKSALALAGLSVMLGLALEAAAEDYSLAPRNTPKAMLANVLATRAIRVLEGRGEPRSDQLTRARIFLDLALQTNPEDADLWSFRAELAERLGDPRTALEAMRQYTRLRPEDDAAQLNLALKSLDAYQTVDERLAATERLLNAPGAQQLSMPLRSRLSSAAALAAREMGDTRRFATHLIEAVQLDATNTQAARLTYEFALSRNASSAEMAVAAMAMIKANPTDPEARMTLGSLLLSQGVYDRAAEQFAAARMLWGGPVSPSELTSYYPGWILSLGASGQPEEALTVLSQAEAALGHPPTTEPSEGAEASAPGAALPLDLELLRLVLYSRSGRQSSAEGSFGRMRQVLRQAQESDPAQAASLAWLCVLFQRDLAEVPKLLDAYLAQGSTNDPLVRRIRGWLELRRGQTAHAREIFKSLAATDPFALYGLAQTYDRANQPERLDALRQVVAMAPSDLAGMMAAQDLLLAGVTVPVSQQGTLIAQKLAEWPRGLTSPKIGEKILVLMQIIVEPQEFSYLDPIECRIRLRNATDMPLSIGFDGVVSPKVALVLSPRRVGISMGELTPQVVDVGRHLRIEPRQSVDVPVRLDRGPLGSLLDLLPTERVGFGIYAVLDPRPLPGGKLGPSFLGTTHSINIVQRHGLPLSEATIEDWLRGLSDAVSPVERFKNLAVLSVVATQMGDALEAKHVTSKVISAVNAAYGRLDPLGQAWTLLFLPPTPEARTAFKSIHDAAQRSSDPLVQIAYVATQVTDPDSPEMNSALRKRGMVGEFAVARREALVREAEEAEAAKIREEESAPPPEP